MIGFEYDDGGRQVAGYRGSTGDCLARAIAIVRYERGDGGPADIYEVTYREVADAMAAHGYSRSGNAYRQYGPRRGRTSARRVQDKVLEAAGFVKVKLPPGPCPTYSEAHERYGDCIVTTNKHFAALVAGSLRDLFDGRTYDGRDFGLDDAVVERKARSVWVMGEGPPAPPPPARLRPADLDAAEQPDGSWRYTATLNGQDVLMTWRSRAGGYEWTAGGRSGRAGSKSDAIRQINGAAS